VNSKIRVVDRDRAATRRSRLTAVSAARALNSTVNPVESKNVTPAMFTVTAPAPPSTARSNWAANNPAFRQVHLRDDLERHVAAVVDELDGEIVNSARHLVVPQVRPAG
jgi:hypothetical protein